MQLWPFDVQNETLLLSSVENKSKSSAREVTQTRSNTKEMPGEVDIKMQRSLQKI